MGYRPEIYRQATEVLQQRRLRAETTAHAHKLKAEQEIPELRALNAQIAQAGLQAAKAIGMKENADVYIAELAAQNLQAQAKRNALLQQAGFPEDYLTMPYACSKCCDTGYCGGLRCSCFDKLLADLAWADLAAHAPLARNTFESFRLSFYSKRVDPQTGFAPYDRMQEILELCKRYAAEFHTHSASLFLYGETGLGKTHLSLAIAGEVVAKGFDVIYGSAQNLLDQIEREHFKRENEGATQAILDCDLLIVDDLGSEFSTQFTVSAVYNIVNTRLQAEKPVIISTNLPVKELEKRYTRRITSRIFGSYTTLAFCGSDIRQKLN